MEDSQYWVFLALDAFRNLMNRRDLGFSLGFEFDLGFQFVVGHTKDTSAFNRGPDGNTDGSMKLIVKVNFGYENEKEKTLGSKV